ncbi:hypothetical protein CEP53_003413 [Fusarium sp. AF-6]|nr:hypothetical protein CEP53_003413 [Fusarium sp. AF-6]
MLSSRTTPKISFNVAIELMPKKPADLNPVGDDHEVATWKIALLNDDWLIPEYGLVGPSFDYAEVAAGLPKVKAAIDALSPDTTPNRSRSAKVRVGVQGGISGGETSLLAKKIVTLVMVLERCLLGWLKKRRSACLVSSKSQVAMGPWPQRNVVSPDYYSHIPPIATMKPTFWNNLEPETMYRKLSMIWSAPGLQEVRYILGMWPPCDPGFYVWPPRELPLSLMPWGFKETPQDPSPWWRGVEKVWGNSIKTQWDPEEGYTYFYFTYLRSTLNHTLLYNWAKVIVRIVELALAGPDEYKRCLETIFRILHEADQGDDEARQKAWEQLMKHILKLEDCIPDWRDYISGRYA